MVLEFGLRTWAFFREEDVLAAPGSSTSAQVRYRQYFALFLLCFPLCHVIPYVF